VRRRAFLRAIAALGGTAAGSLYLPSLPAAVTSGVSVTELPALEGDLTLYLGRGEGGLYEDILAAIRKRNPALNLQVRRGPTAALANTLVAEARAGISRADLFWAVDTGALGLVTEEGLPQPLPPDLIAQLKPGYRYSNWAPISGRIRTLPYHSTRFGPDRIPDSVMALADTDLKPGWAPAYGAFQSFITAMRLIEGESATREWLCGLHRRARSYAGELGVVMAVARGEVDLGFANHYYTLRLKAGQPEAAVAMAFTRGDAGCLLNASGIVALRPGRTAINFIRYLLTREVQSWLAAEAYEIPMIAGASMPAGLPPLEDIKPPELDLTRLADLRPTLDLMRDAGVL